MILEPGGVEHEAAKQAARDERDRHRWPISDYQVGRLAEGVLAVAEGRPLDVDDDGRVDVDSREVA